MALRIREFPVAREFPEPREIPITREFPRFKLFPPVSREMGISREFPARGFPLNITALVGATAPQGRSWELSESVVLVAMLLVDGKSTRELTVTATCLSKSSPSKH